GCKPNVKLAVRYLQKAAESAVSDLHTSMAANPSIARHELVLAIYEL
ncbi:15908_t:CDS:1, partial [Acaulospora colombiana]